MPNDPGQRSDETEKSLGDQATGADVLKKRNEDSIGKQRTRGGDLPVDPDDPPLPEKPIVDLSERFEIQESIGKGGMGEVRRAFDTKLRRHVAIKRVLGEMARSKTALQRFETEAQSIAKLNHFNIVQVYDYLHDAEGPYIIMELVEGESLQERLREGAFELEEAVNLTCQLCDGLAVAHDQGIIHRDIKPANILLTEDGAPKLTDFGLARQESVDHGQTQKGELLGTIDFMPPEQRLDATAADARSDLWSLAATLYQMLTGKRPNPILFKNVPTALQDVLEKALEEEQADRYQTAQEFRNALRDSLETIIKFGPELRTGECGECKTTNDVSRKFCRKCRAALIKPCLSCETDNRVWEDVCGECGASQQEERAKIAEVAKAAAKKAVAITAAFAKKDWRKVLELDPDNSEALEMKAVAEAKAAEKAAAKAAAKKAAAEKAEAKAAEKAAEKAAAKAAAKKAAAEKMEDLCCRNSFNHAIAMLNRGLNSRDYTSGVVREEFDTWKNAAERGNDVAQWLLGDCYLEGIGVPYNSRLAVTWFEKAAEAGLPAAQHSLGNNLWSGDLSSALSWIKKAVAQDYAPAIYIYGIAKWHGLGESRDPAEAVELFQQATDKGCTVAQYQLAKCLFQGRGIEQDAVRGRDLLRESADSGFVRAQTELAEKLITESQADPASFGLRKEAIDWLRQAADMNYPKAITLLEELNQDSKREVVTNSIGMEMVTVPRGRFYMGSNDWPEKWKHFRDENPRHQVFLSNDILVGTFPITQLQYRTVMESNPSKFKKRMSTKHDSFPVEMVSWYDAIRFCNRLSYCEDLDPFYEINGDEVQIIGGVGYRLPFEAEWECAARSGTQTNWWFGNQSEFLGVDDEISKFAWFQKGESRMTTRQVGQKRANWFGLFDILGNVWEWCWDYFQEDYYEESPEIDPIGPAAGTERVLRGGSFGSHSLVTRPALRESNPPLKRCDDVGFRVVRTDLRPADKRTKH